MKSEEFEKLNTIGLVAYASAWCAKEENFKSFVSKLEGVVGHSTYRLVNWTRSATVFWVVWDGKSIAIEMSQTWGRNPSETFVWFGTIETFDRSQCSYPYVDAECTCDDDEDTECPACDLGDDWCETHSNYH